MEKDALVEVAIREASYTKDYRTRGTVVLAEAAIAALGANGYVVVPEPLLRELLDAARSTRLEHDSWERLYTAAAAVVEAVGPTT